MFESVSYDLVLLDLMIPKISGMVGIAANQKKKKCGSGYYYRQKTAILTKLLGWALARMIISRSHFP